MATQRYEITEAFRYEAYTPDGVVEGEFSPGVTGDDLTDEQALYLDQHAVPAGFAAAIDDSATPAPAPAPAPKPTPAAPVPAATPDPTPSDTQEQAK